MMDDGCDDVQHVRLVERAITGRFRVAVHPPARALVLPPAFRVIRVIKVIRFIRVISIT